MLHSSSGCRRIGNNLLPMSGVKTQISGHPTSNLVTVLRMLSSLQKQIMLRKIIIFYISFCYISVANNYIVFNLYCCTVHFVESL